MCAQRHGAGGRTRQRCAVAPGGDNGVPDRAASEDRCHQPGIASGEVAKPGGGGIPRKPGVLRLRPGVYGQLTELQPELPKPRLRVSHGHLRTRPGRSGRDDVGRSSRRSGEHGVMRLVAGVKFITADERKQSRVRQAVVRCAWSAASRRSRASASRRASTTRSHSTRDASRCCRYDVIDRLSAWSARRCCHQIQAIRGFLSRHHKSTSDVRSRLACRRKKRHRFPGATGSSIGALVRHHDRDLGDVNELVGDAPDEHAGEAGKSTPAHDDQVGSALVDSFDDRPRELSSATAPRLTRSRRCICSP
jgi:hypothetical protein